MRKYDNYNFLGAASAGATELLVQATVSTRSLYDPQDSGYAKANAKERRYNIKNETVQSSQYCHCTTW